MFFFKLKKNNYVCMLSEMYKFASDTEAELREKTNSKMANDVAKDAATVYP